MAKCTTPENFDNVFFRELTAVIKKYDPYKTLLLCKVDEKVASVDHKLPPMVGSADIQSPAVTLGMS